MKQMLKSVLMVLVVLVCATSLAFAGGDKNRKRNESQTKQRSGESFQTVIDGKLLLSANRKRGGDRDQRRDGSCLEEKINLDSKLLLAGNGNGNGGTGDNGGNGPGNGTGNNSDGDGPAGDGTGNGAPDGAGDCPGTV